MENEKRLIDANALSKSIKEGNGTELQKFFADVCVATAPTVDAVEVVHGRWVMKETVIKSPFAKNIYCSECLHETVLASNYCPNCGADMRERK